MNTPPGWTLCQFVAVVTSEMLKTSSEKQPRNRADQSGRERAGREVAHHQSEPDRAASQAKISKSALRTDTRALITGSRSIEAITSATKRLGDANPIAVIAGHCSPLSLREARRGIEFVKIVVYQMPDTRLSHVTASSVATQQTKRPPERPAASELGVWSAAYSAAILRGGSSAPESWISATW